MKDVVLISFHILLQLLAFTSWFWLDYRALTVIATLHLIMLEVLKGCPLSHFQFKTDKDKRFYEWELDRIGVKLSARSWRRLRLFMQYGLPVIVVMLAVVLQVVVGFKPIISF